MSVCKNEKQIQIGKVPSLNFKLFLFLQKWGWTANWRIQIFCERLAYSILGNIFNPCRKSKTSLQFRDSQFEKWRHNFFGKYFESILSTRQFLNILVTSIYRTTASNFGVHSNTSQFLVHAASSKAERTTMHWQKTGQDNLTSAVVRYQLRFGAGPLRLTFSLLVIFRSQFTLVGRAWPAMNSPFLAYAKRCTPA